MIRVGLIGFGLAGQVFHAPTIRAVAGMELACILQRTRSLAQERYPDVRVARTLEDLLADETIGLCVVATPNTSHFELARHCLLAGRDVVIDKPFTVTTQEARELVELAKQKKRLLTVYQNRRWDGDFRTVRKIIESGELGTIKEYEARFDRFRLEPKPNAWREREEPGSGMLFDLGAHLIDQALTLFGTPQWITASVFHQRQGTQVDDAFDVFLDYPNLRASLRSRIVAYAPGPHFVLHGTEGSFIKYGLDPQEDRTKAATDFQYREEFGIDPESQWGVLTRVGEKAGRKIKTENGDYIGFYANVRDAIEHRAPLQVTPEQALQTMQVIELASRSSRERRAVAGQEMSQKQ